MFEVSQCRWTFGHFLSFFRYRDVQLGWTALFFNTRSYSGASVIFVLGCINFSYDLISLSLVKKKHELAQRPAFPPDSLSFLLVSEKRLSRVFSQWLQLQRSCRAGEQWKCNEHEDSDSF